MTRRQAAICLAAGLVLLVAAPFAWAWLTPDPAGETVTDLNAAAAVALADTTSATSADAGSPVDPTADLTTDLTIAAPPAAALPVAAPPVTARPAIEPAVEQPVAEQSAAPAPAPDPVPAEPAPGAAGTPVRLQLPTLGIDSPVIPIGVTGSGELEIPEDVDDIGWYRYGPAPGAVEGSAVLSGHVDSARQGPGPFARLGELAEGDILVVVDETGAARSFTVLAREAWPKSEVPLDRIFDRGGSGRLVLITCGGDFDADSGHYEDNIAITAVPVPASSS